MEHFNKLTPAEAERLAFVLEEMGEVAQAIGKVLRHGYESRYGDDTNRDRLTDEIADLAACLALLGVAKDVDLASERFGAGPERKIQRLRKYSHHQTEELFDDLD